MSSFDYTQGCRYYNNYCHSPHGCFCEANKKYEENKEAAIDLAKRFGKALTRGMSEEEAWKFQREMVELGLVAVTHGEFWALTKNSPPQSY